MLGAWQQGHPIRLLLLPAMLPLLVVLLLPLLGHCHNMASSSRCSSSMCKSSRCHPMFLPRSMKIHLLLPTAELCSSSNLLVKGQGLQATSIPSQAQQQQQQYTSPMLPSLLPWDLC